MRVLIACEYSGRMREAFRAKGHTAFSCDLLPSEDNSKHHIIGDALKVAMSEPWDLLIAHPPCTYLANSGVRWLWKNEECLDERGNWVKLSQEVPARWDNMRSAAGFFASFLNLRDVIPKIAVENPVMHHYGVSAIERAANMEVKQHFIQPWWFGDKAFKATGFTLFGLAPLKKPATALTPPEYGSDEYKAWSVVHRASPSPTRWKERSRTFPGVARACAEAWG